MKRLSAPRSLVTLALLLIAASALVSGIKAGVLGVEDAAFLPVAMFATLLGYALGYGTWPARRAWVIILTSGLFVVFIEAARLHDPLTDLIRSIPRIQVDLLKNLLAKQSLDFTLLSSLTGEIAGRAGFFFTTLTREIQNEVEATVLREVLWDIPLLVLPAWAGWWTARHNKIWTAFGPSLALHALILDYTSERTLSLQIAAFVLLLLLGINQNWNLAPGKSGTSERTLRETYSTIVVLSFFLSLGAGLMPSFSIQEAAEKLTTRDDFSETLGLEKEIARNYAASSSGLPRGHLIGMDPSTLRTIVFTVGTGERPFLLDEQIEAPEVPRHYWRWLVYDVYDGRKWTTSHAQSIEYGANESLFPLQGERYQIVHQQVEKTSLLDDHLYWTGALARANQPFESTWRVSPDPQDVSTDPLLYADMLGARTDQETYLADSLIPIVSEAELRASSTDYPFDIRNRYLSLPNTIPGRVLQLADELAANIENPYDRARAIEAYLRTYPYLLDVPPAPEGQEVADYFLFDLKTGYCDYYATSMVVLARAVGLPARLVIGYSSGEYDRTTGTYIVREMHAHSWVEVYFTDIGWVEFEPTANQPAISLPAEIAQERSPVLASAFRTERNGDQFGRNGFFLERNYLPAIAALAAILLWTCIQFLRTQGLLMAHPSIGSMYEYVYRHGKRIYTDAPLNETPSIFAEQLKRKLRNGYRLLAPAPAELEYLTALYMRETYSPHPIREDEHRQAMKIWRRLFWRLLYARTVRL